MSTEAQPIIIPPETINNLLTASLKELKSQRRRFYLGWAFKVLLFIAFVAVVGSAGQNGLFQQKSGNPMLPHVGFVEIYGPISADQAASADRIIPALQKAYENPQSQAVVMRINSPGGSPVQASIIFNEVMLLKAKYPEKPLYAVIEDVGASAAYFIASAANQIYADKASLVGSIGVISSGFGFPELMQKVGVERRVTISGKNKSLLDPYSPINEDVQEYWQGLLDGIHDQFIQAVKTGRQDKLAEDNGELFSGLVWTGEASKPLGLIDDFGNILTISREYANNDKTNLVNYTPAPDLFKHLGTRASAEIKGWLINAQTPLLY